MKHNVKEHVIVLPPSNDTAFIYGLVDPRTGYIRYVGKAVDPERRYNDHFSKFELSPNTKKVNWIKSLLAQELKPSIILLEKTHSDAWREAERRWIAFYRSIPGYPELTNGTSGGDGAEKGSKHRPESLRKMIIFHNTKEWLQKISECSRRRPKREDCTSKFIGVSWAKHEKLWRSCLMTNRKTIGIGYFKEEIDAARARDCRAIVIFGDDAVLNFPRPSYSDEEIAKRIQKHGKSIRNKSGYKGVSWNKEHNKWTCDVRRKGVGAYFGYFPATEQGKLAAARTFDRWVIEHLDEFAYTNFPRSDYE
jgi:hypothetical protein